MAEAKAKMTLDASGATKGAKEFQNAADIIFNADKKAKTQLEKPAKTEAPAKKAKADLNGIASELSRVTSVSGGLEMALSKIGGGLKVAGAVALVMAIGKGIYDATQSALELDLAMGRIARRNFGGVGGRELSGLQENLTIIRQAREENQKALMGEGTNFFKTIGGGVSRAMARTGAAITGNNIEVLSPAEREDKLREAEIKALDRIAAKQKEIWGIEKERVLGNREAAEIMQIEAEYAEKVQSAVASRNTSLQAQLNDERAELIAAAKRQQSVALSQRGTMTKVAEMRSFDANQALGLSTQEEQRQANRTGILSAGLAAQDAQAAAAASPKDPELAARAKVALQEVVRLNAENAKWERDIARSNSDSLKSSIAENEAKSFELKGQTSLAAITRQRAANELAIVQAQRLGNRELADQLKISGDLERSELARRRVMEGDRVLRASQVRSRERQAEVDAALSERVSRRFADSEGRISASTGRSPRSRRIGGARFDRAGRAAVGSGDDWEAMVSEMSSNDGSRSFDQQFKPRGLDVMREASGSNAIAEMGFRKNISDIGMTRAERADALNKQKEERISSGKADPSEALASIAQILAKWDT